MSDVSVVIPTFNMGRFLPEAIGSIARQDRKVAEILVVDRSSTDGTPEIVAKLAEHAPVRLIESDANAPGSARNVAIRAATGRIIAFLDADDLWPEGKLARQLDHLANHPGHGMVSGFVRYFDILDPATLTPAADSRVETLFHVHLGACLYRREVFDRIGLFDETLLYSEDVDLLLRVREAEVDFTILRGIMLYYRKHPTSMMAQSNPRKSGDFRRAVAKSVARRRTKGQAALDMNLFETYLEPLP